MLFCPSCGSGVKLDESYCVICGNKLPDDMDERLNGKKPLHKFWLIPLFTCIFFVITSGVYYLFLMNQIQDAKGLYEEGEQLVLQSEYKQAKNKFEDALKKKSNFMQAESALEFTNKAIHVESMIQDANELSMKDDYQQALSVMTDAEKQINNYIGTAVDQLIKKIVNSQNALKTDHLKKQLADQPSIDELKNLLWEADAIKNEEAIEITNNIREQIVDYTHSKASELSNKKQFSDAIAFIEDAMQFAPRSEKLQSLEKTIEKEKSTFETTQQERIEQAISTAEKEQKVNEKDAVKLVSVKVDNDKQGNLVIKGEVKSVATVPITSVQVNYAIAMKKGDEFLKNDVFVYPDTLYPNETGKFEFTHYDIQEASNRYQANVKKITWYTD